MQKVRKILVAVVIALILALTFDAVIINLTAPEPSKQIVSKIEQNPSFQTETANATYAYLGYDNGRTSPIHCGPVITGLSQIGSFIHLFWPPANHTAVSFIFAVQTNSTPHSGFPYSDGLLYVEGNPNTGEIYGMTATGLCL